MIKRLWNKGGQVECVMVIIIVNKGKRALKLWFLALGLTVNVGL